MTGRSGTRCWLFPAVFSILTLRPRHWRGNDDVDIDNTAIEPNAGETHSGTVFQNLQLRKLQSIPGFTDC